MSPTPAVPHGASSGAARIQRDHEDDPDAASAAQLQAWLDDPVLERAGLNLARQLGDAELLLKLQLSGYAPKVWDPIANEFARYGVAVIRSWIANGSIAGRVKARTKFTLAACPHEWLLDQHVIEELAHLTVAKALAYFLDNVLRQNKWEPARGASLTTFFIGQCLFQYANVYREWLLAEQSLRRGRVVAEEVTLEALAGGFEDLERVVCSRDEARRALAAVTTTKARTAFAMKAAGFSQEEIALHLGLDGEKSVENLLGYQVKRWARRNGAPDDDRRTS